MSSLTAPADRVTGVAARFENGLAIVALLAMAILPVAELVLRSLFHTGIPGTSGYVQNLTLWVGFVGAMIAAREGRHLNLSVGSLGLTGRPAQLARMTMRIVCVLVAAGLFWASLQFVLSERVSEEMIGPWMPVWVAELILPVSFLAITLRFLAAPAGACGRAIVLLALPVGAAVVFLMPGVSAALVVPAIVVLIGSAFLRTPIFVVVGGITLVLFFAAEVPAGAIAVSSYRIVVSPLIATIPLFTLVGYLLAEGGARDRLVRLFGAWFGWMPGGEAVVAVLLCAFFTTFTGASGVVILAVGGLLLPLLIKAGYPQRFSIGLVTASGSIGLLFPPSIVIIIYATMTHVPIPQMFLAGLLPGIIMVVAICAYGVWQGRATGVERRPFDGGEAFAALRGAGWELATPVIILIGVFGGFATLTEAAAIALVYVLCVEVFVHREIDPLTDLPRVMIQCICLIGGVFAILGVAFGLANYMVDADIPTMAADFVKEHVGSRLLFLLLLNIFLLIVGCLMDIFSAIVVVSPLILPASAAFGIHPAHLGVIFLANLELGYLTPPVGLNLFLSAYRFDRSMMEVCRSALPFLGLLFIVVILVTYVPELTLVAGSR